MSDTKKEHYVPQFYLKKFCGDDNKIWVYDKKSKNIRKQRVSEVAMENYFYDLDMDKVPMNSKNEKEIQRLSNLFLEQGLFLNPVQMKSFLKKYVEKDFLSEIEPQFAKLLRNISINASRATSWQMNNCYAFSIEEKKQLSLMFANQLMRTKTMREKYKKTMEEVYADLSDDYLRREKKELESIEISKEVLKWLHAAMITDFKLEKFFSDIFNNHIWVLLVNRTSKSLMTSDNPIAMIPNVFTSHKGKSGIASEGVELLFPITPNLIIGMYERSFFKNKIKERTYKEIIDSKLIDRFNTAQILSSYRCIFSNNNDFDFVENLINENPTLTDFNSYL